MSLLFDILNNWIFLIQIKQPFDINTLLHPNTKWNYTGYSIIKYSVKDYQLMDDTDLDEQFAIIF